MEAFVSSRGCCLTVLGSWHPCPAQILPPTCSQMSQDQALVSQGSVPEQLDLSQSSYRCVCSREGGKKPKTLCRSWGFLFIGSSPDVPGKEGEMIRGVLWLGTSRHSLSSCSMWLAEPGLKKKRSLVLSLNLCPYFPSISLGPMGHTEQWAGQLPMDTETCTKVEGSYTTLTNTHRCAPA